MEEALNWALKEKQDWLSFFFKYDDDNSFLL